MLFAQVIFVLRIPQTLAAALAFLINIETVVSSESDLFESDQLTVQLITDVTAISPGDPFLVGLFLKPKAGYHTYWKGPGIVGVATDIRWQLPTGFSAGDIIWPAPDRVDMVGFNAHGYNRETCLLVEIDTPKKIQTELVNLKAKATWMCCDKTCHPGFADFELILPVNSSRKPALKIEERRLLFQRTLDTVPPKSPDDWTISAQLVTRDSIELNVMIPNLEGKNVDNIYFFCYDLQVNSDISQKVTLTDLNGSRISFSLARSDFAPDNPKTLEGVIYHPSGWPDLNSNYAEISFDWPAGDIRK